MGAEVNVAVPAPTNVLLVDDSDNDLALMQTALEAKGCKVFKAASSANALNILTSEKIDLVLCDVVMPDGGGLAFLDQVHQMGLKIRMAVVTGFDGGPVVEEVRAKFPVVTIVTKPITSPRANELIDDLLEHFDGI